MLDAMRMVLAERRSAPALLQHSDRGSQYAGAAYQALLTAHGLTCSMSRKGDCSDNAVAGSFFATREHELLAEADFPPRHATGRAIYEFIEVWYNRERRHSNLGYVSPAECEAQLEQRQRAAKPGVHQIGSSPIIGSTFLDSCACELMLSEAYDDAVTPAT